MVLVEAADLQTSLDVLGYEKAQNLPAYYTVQSRFEGIFAEMLWIKKALIRGVLVDNTREPHIAAQLVKYPRVLSTKSLNKMYCFQHEKFTPCTFAYKSGNL